MSYTRAELRAECKKVLPRFKWTTPRGSVIYAHGTQSAGFNRTATIEVVPVAHGVEVGMFGYGTRGDKIGHGFGATVTTAIRDLQNKLVAGGNLKLTYARDLEEARPEPRPDYEPVRSARADTRVDELQAQLEAAKQEIAALREQLTEAEEEAADLREQRAEAREALHDLHADYEDRTRS